MSLQDRLVQLDIPQVGRRVALATGAEARLIDGVATIRELAFMAIADARALGDLARELATGDSVNLVDQLAAGNVLPAIDHDDSARILLTGTGLTHLGSAEGRDKMHRDMAASNAPTDSMRMFLEGIEGGKPAEGEIGQQPEWFYKGDGQSLVGPCEPLVSPSCAQDGGEEPELAGIYLIGEDGTPYRLGIALANEFSDHVTERHNYLWLAHSKLRPAAIGGELLLGTPPVDIRGTSRILRDGAVAWEKPFLTGEANMSHSIANLEAHHFKYAGFRRPGDIHVHFFGTATLSFSEGFETREGDVFEIEANAFALPLRNPLANAKDVPAKTIVL